MRKKRTLTEEQKQAAAERLAKAREKRMAANPPQYSNYCSEVVGLPEDHPMSFKKVRQWIKNAKSRATAEKYSYKAGDNKALARSMVWTNYCNQLEHYLRSGDFIGRYYGENMEYKIKSRCAAMAYFPNGKPKREFGVWYSDVNGEWTPEMENDERERFGMERLRYNERGYQLIDGDDEEYVKPSKKKKREMTPEQKQALVERLKKARESKAAKTNAAK